MTDPPPGALRETVATVRAAIGSGGGSCVEAEGMLLGVVLWSEKAGALYFGRLAVTPASRGQGVGRALVMAAETEARRRGLARIELGTRLALTGNRAFFAACGYREGGLETHAGFAAPTSVVMDKAVEAGRPPAS